MAKKQQCAGKVTNPKAHNLGEPCRRWAVNGSEYCAVHGGSLDGNYNPADLQNRCVAHSTRTGAPCKLPAIAGGTVCRIHGGSAKHVQKKARELLDRAVEPALYQLRDILLKPNTSDSDRLRAVQMVLDRSGLTPGITVQHEVKPWEVTLNSIIRVMPPDTQMGELPPQPSLEDIEDAEVIEYEEPDPENVVRLRPAYGVNKRATVRGSSEPPKRKR